MKNDTRYYESVRQLFSMVGQAHKFLKEGSVGDWSIKYRYATKRDCEFEQDRICLGMNIRDRLPLTEGLYTYLLWQDESIMSDTSTELLTNLEFIANARGDVLIGGLGLGLMAQLIANKPDVRSVTIIEKSPEVYSLVSPTLPVDDRYTVIMGDVFQPDRIIQARKFDTIYMDIWAELGEEEEKEMAILKNLYTPLLKDHGWLGCWEQKI